MKYILPYKYLCFFIFLFFTQDLVAQADFTWNGSVSTNWLLAPNWTLTAGSDGDGLPDANDHIIIPTGTPNNPLLPDVASNYVEIGSIQLNGEIRTNSSSDTLRINEDQSVSDLNGTLGSTAGFGGLTTLGSSIVEIDINSGATIYTPVVSFNAGGESRIDQAHFYSTVVFNGYGDFGTYRGLRAKDNLFEDTFEFNGLTVSGGGSGNIYYFGGNIFRADALFTLQSDIAPLWIGYDNGAWFDPALSLDSFEANLEVRHTNSTRYIRVRSVTVDGDAHYYGNSTTTGDAIQMAHNSGDRHRYNGKLKIFQESPFGAAFNDGLIRTTQCATCSLTVADSTVIQVENGGSMMMSDGGGHIQFNGPVLLDVDAASLNTELRLADNSGTIQLDNGVNTTWNLRQGITRMGHINQAGTGATHDFNMDGGARLWMLGSFTFGGDVNISSTSDGTDKDPTNPSWPPAALRIANEAGNTFYTSGELFLNQNGSANATTESSASWRDDYAFVIGGDGTIEVQGDLTVNDQTGGLANAVQLVNTRNHGWYNHSDPPTGQVIFSGGNTQALNTNMTNPDFYAIQVNKSGGKVNLNADVQSTGSFTLNSGIFNLQSNDLALSGATISGSFGNGTHVEAHSTGLLSRTTSGATLFPIGDGSTYLPATVTPSTGQTVSARIENSASYGGNNYYINRSWEITGSAGGSGTVAFQWPSSVELINFDPMDAGLMAYIAGSWSSLSTGQDYSGSDPRTDAYGVGSISQKFTYASFVTANAGPDQNLNNCGFATMAAVDPSSPPSGYPIWSYDSGASASTVTYEDINAYNSVVSNLAPGTHKFLWQISPTIYDSVYITIGSAFTPDPTQTWNGQVDNDWFNCANWTGNMGEPSVPNASTNVIIPGGLSRYPVLTADAQANDLDLRQAGQLDLNGHDLSASGFVSLGDLSGNRSTLISNGGSLTVSDRLAQFEHTTIQGNFTLNSSASGWLTDAGGLRFTSDFTVHHDGTGYLRFGQTGTDTVMGNLIFNSTGTGILNWARRSMGTNLVMGSAQFNTANAGLIRVCFFSAGGSPALARFDGPVEFTNTGQGGNWGAINVGRQGDVVINGNLTVRNLPGTPSSDEPDIRFSQRNNPSHGLVEINGNLYLEMTRPEIGGRQPRVSLGFNEVSGGVNLNGRLLTTGGGLVDGRLYIGDFRQNAAGLSILTTSGNHELYMDSARFDGPLQIVGEQLSINNSLFQDTVHFTNVNEDNWGNCGGNTFQAKATIQMANQGAWYWGVDGPDIFNDTLIARATETVTPIVPANIDPNTGYTTNFTTNYPENLTPIGDTAVPSLVNQAQSAASDAEDELNNTLSALNAALAFADSALKYDAGCGVSMSEITDSINAATALMPTASSNHTDADNLTIGVSTHGDVNPINAVTNMLFERINAFNTFVNTTNSTSNTCNSNVRNTRLNSGRLYLANATTGNQFNGYTRLEALGHARLFTNASSTTNSSVFSGDSLVLYNESAGGYDGAVVVGFHANATVDINTPTLLNNAALDVNGRHAEARILLGGLGVLNINENVIVENSSGHGSSYVHIGDPRTANSALVTLSAGRTISEGSNGFNIGELGIANLKQTTTEQHEFIIPKANYLSNYGTHWQGRLLVDASQAIIRRSDHEAYASYTHRGEGNTTDCGYNHFRDTLILNDRGTEEDSWRWGIVGPDTMHSYVQANVLDHAILSLPEYTSGNLFMGKVEANLSAGRLYIARSSNSSSPDTIATFQDTVLINNTGRGMATGSDSWNTNALSVGFFQDGITSPASTNTTIFERPLYIYNTSPSDSADLSIGYRGAVLLKDSIHIDNNLTGPDEGQTIGFGVDDWPGACQCSFVEMANGARFKVDRFTDGTLLMRRFYQRGSTSQEIKLNTNVNLILDSVIFEGQADIKGRGFQVSRSKFYDTTQLTCLEYGYSTSGGNEFFRPTTIEFRGIGSNAWSWSGAIAGDYFHDKVNFWNTGTGTSRFFIGRNKFGTTFDSTVGIWNAGNDQTRMFFGNDNSGDSTFNIRFMDSVNVLNESSEFIRFGFNGINYFHGPITLENGGTGDLQFWSNGSNGDTLYNNRGDMSIKSWTGTGDLLIQNFHQVGEDTITLDMPNGTGGNRYLQVEECSFDARLNLSSSHLNLRDSRFNGPLGATMNGNNNPSYMHGGNRFNDSASFVHNGSAEWRLTNADGNDFNGPLTVRELNGGVADFQIAFRDTTFIGHDLHIESNAVQNFSINRPFCCGADGIARFDGDSSATLSSDLPIGQTIVIKRGQMVKTHATDSLILSDDLYLEDDGGATAQFDFLKGRIYVDTSVLLIDHDLTVTGGSDSSYMMPTDTGTVRLLAANSTTKTLPLGNGLAYFPLIASQSAGSDNMAIRLHQGVNDSYDAQPNPNGTGYTGYFLNNVWVLEETGANPLLRMGWSPTGELPGVDRSTMVPMQWDGSIWDCISAPETATGGGPYFLSSFVPSGEGPYSAVSMEADAGPSAFYCHTTSAALSANVGIPSGFTYEWEQASGPSVVSFSDVNNPSATVTGMTDAGTYVFRWRNTEFGTNCPDVFASVTLTIVGNGGGGTPGVWTGLENRDWFNCANWDNGYVPTSATDVTVPTGVDSMPVIEGGIAYAQALTINSGGHLHLVSDSLHVYGDLSNNGIYTQDAHAVLNLKDTADFQGTQNLDRQAVLWFTPANQAGARLNANSMLRFAKLGIETSPATNGVELAQDVLVKDSLLLQNGVFHTNAGSVLHLDSQAVYTGYSDSALVAGRVRKTFASTNKFWFPVGEPGRERSLSLQPAAATATDFEVDYTAVFPNPFAALQVSTAQGTENLNRASNLEYWDVDRSSGTEDAYMELTWDALSDVSNQTADLSDLRVAHWNGSEWENISLSGTAVTGTPTAGVVSNPLLVSSFSPFTLGSLISNNPLPLSILGFQAEKEEQDALLNWTLNKSTNVSQPIQLQRSKDGVEFETIESYTLSRSGLSTFSYVDKGIGQELPHVYYRLRLVEPSGEEVFSELRVLTFMGKAPFLVYPNPAKDDVHIELGSQEVVQLQLVDAQGRIVRQVPHFRIQNALDVADLSSGYYMIQIRTSSGEQYQHALILNH